MMGTICVMRCSQASRMQGYCIKNRKSFRFGYSASGYEFLAYCAGTDCFSSRCLHNEVPFLLLQRVLKSNDLPTCRATPKLVNILPSMTLSLCLSGRKGNGNGWCQDGSRLCLDTRLACLVYFFERLAVLVGVGNAGLRLGCQSKLWRLSYFVA